MHLACEPPESLRTLDRCQLVIEDISRGPSHADMGDQGDYRGPDQ